MILYFLLCIISTTVGAISGIGGGVIIKPVFDFFSGMPVATISFLSGCTVLSMSIVSLLCSRGGKVKVDTRRGTLLAVGAAVGGVMGKMAFEWVKSLAGNDGLIGVVQNSVMVLITGGVLLYVLNKSHIKTLQTQSAVRCATIGLVLGVLGAFLGIGGGPINLIALYFFFSMDTKTAALNSIYIILFSQITSLVTALAQKSINQVNVTVLIVMVIGGIMGGLIGRTVNKHLAGEQVDVLFTSILFIITGISVCNCIKYVTILMR